MKREGKIVFISLIVMLISLSFVVAATNSSNTSNGTNSGLNSNVGTLTVNSGSNSDAVNNGYKCLDSKLKNKTASEISLEDAIFSTLAIGEKEVTRNKINNEKSTSENCWSKTKGCNIKETAQVLLAYQRIGKERSGIINWLSSKNVTSGDLNWYMEIDISNKVASECTLKYDGAERKIKILENMKISGNPGSCFSISSSGYWLLFKENCYDKPIQITCDQDFITALIYQKKNGGTFYVLPDTQSASALGSTEEKVSAKCFKTGSSCDYEGSLWATLALNKEGKNIDAFIPYLIALSDTNQKYFPSAFLYSLTAAEDQYTEIVQGQKQNRYWEVVSSPYGKFYDTALAMLGLSKSGSSLELENTKSYLLSIQSKDGCWDNGNIRNTAFLLYSGWSKGVSASSDSSGSTLCEEVSSQSCENRGSCIDAGGLVLSNFQCSGFNVCCSVKVQEASCSEKQGTLCKSDETCDGTSVPSSDIGECCMNSCVPVQEEDSCTPFGGLCKSSCDSGESQDSSASCTLGNICCKASESSGSSWWIWILIILIILIALAIIFRNKLQIWWFKFKGKAKVTPIVKPSSPSPGYRLAQPRPMARPTANYPVQQPRNIQRRPTSDKDKEMEETLRKLREMSK